MDLPPPPASGEIAGGWLHGRGSSDSKAGAAIFAHVAARLRDTAGGRTGAGAIAKAAHLIRELHEVPLPGPADPEFPLPAKLTVTAVSGGEGYSVVPDLCTFNVDIRLSPALDDPAAVALLRTTAADIDTAWPGTPPTRVEVTTRWPPYALPDGSPLRGALLEAAARAGLAPAAKVAGPSNIGNYLAGLGISATAGFGVDYQGLHGTDECIRLDSIPVVQAAYHQALLTLLHAA